VFLGHYAAGFGTKRIAPRMSLGLLFCASQFIDLLWPIFLLLGLEHVRIDPGNTPFTPLDFTDYPYSHSLAGVLFWAAAFGIAVRVAGRRTSEAIVAAALVASHWVLDFISHRPDLPLAPGSGVMFGLGLWNSVLWTVVVEWTLFAGGVFLYTRATTPNDRRGRYGLILLVVLLSAIALGNLAAPPPPDMSAIAFSGLGLWLFVVLAFWVDRHRSPAAPAPDGGHPT
jgi:hypothetical protein